MPAAGSARRMQVQCNKVLLPLAGRPMLAWTLRALAAAPSVEAIIICIREEDRNEVAKLVRDCAIGKQVTLVTGGRERQDSIRNGIAAMPRDVEYVIVHDAARPLVSTALVERVLNAALEHGAATAAIPCTDTVKEGDENNFVRCTLPRERLHLIQTPQVFRADLLRAAHEHAHKAGLYFTDDASLVEALGIKVKLVMGEPYNIKITHREDLLVAELLLRARIRYEKADVDVNAHANGWDILNTCCASALVTMFTD